MLLRRLLTLFAASLGDFDYDLHADESHPMRSRLGTVLLTLHIVASHIILLNLIVAIMGSTYEFFKENSTKEYKFGRARYTTLHHNQRHCSQMRHNPVHILILRSLSKELAH